jgi:predicted permease
MAVFDALRVDLRDAARRLRRSAGLSAIIVFTLALALAANTTIFSLLEPTVLERLPISDPDGLVGISGADEKTGAYSAIPVSVAGLLARDTHAFLHVAAYTSSFVRVDAGGGAFDTGVEGVTPEYFDVLGVSAGAGRLLGPGDAPLGASGVITERLARRLFGDASPLGRSIMVEGRPVEIVGVAAGDFTGTRMDGGDDLFLPIGFMRWIQGGDAEALPRAQQLIARLAPGVTQAAARAEILGRWPVMRAAAAAEFPAAQQPSINQTRVSVDSFARGFSGLRDAYGTSIALVMGLAIALLAVGCVNLSALMLAHGNSRRRELAIRVALGVSRARLFQQSVIDGVLLALAAFVVSIPIARSASAVLASMLNVARVAPVGDIGPRADTLALAAVAAALIGVVIGLLPVRRAMRGGFEDVLRDRSAVQPIRGSARLVLITQVALSMVLVVGAGLFMATLEHLYANDVISRDRPILFTRLARNAVNRNMPLAETYFKSLQERMTHAPGDQIAAFSVMYPAYLGSMTGIPMDTVSVGAGAAAPALSDWVTPGFFDVYSITRLRGRDFTWADDAKAPRVAIVNDALARRLAPSGEVIGRRAAIVSGAATTNVEIIGVVANAAVTSIRERDVPALYLAMMQDARRAQNPMFHVRVAADGAAVRSQYVDAVNAGGEHFVRGLFTMDEWVDHATLNQQLLAGMSTFGATITVLLSAIGLFGLLAYSVSSRVREIGIRQSLGATRREMLQMIVREGVGVTVPGVAIGVPLALAAAWLLRSQLFGVAATDPWIIAGAILMFVATAVVASWLPALRASRIQPGEALRHE